MDREQAIKLFNMINMGAEVGCDAEGNIVSGTTALGTTLNALGRPTYVYRRALPKGQTVTRTRPDGTTWQDPKDWRTKEAAAFLREWANVMDPPHVQEVGPNDFRKRPVVIQAVQLRRDTWQDMCDHAGVGSLANGRPEGFWPDGEVVGRIGMRIPTLEGLMEATEGDWIIRGVKGELYPCKPDVFAATYEKVVAC